MATHRGDKPVILTIDELRQLSKDTVLETLSALGIDTAKPIEVQRDFQFLRDWRQAAESLRFKALCTAVGILVTGTLAALWLGFKSML